MAKESMKAREKKRAKTVAKYLEKRKALKKQVIFWVCKNFQKMPLPLGCTIVAKSRAGRRAICANLVFQG